MAVAHNIRVYTLERDSLTVAWAIQDTTEDLSQHTVSVWRSEQEGGPYQRVSMEMIASDVFDFQDRAVNILSKWREFYYRIQLTDTNTSAEQFFGSTPHRQVIADGKDPGGVIMEAPPDVEALEAIRRFDMVLREYIGRKVLVLSQRTWGQRCGECWDFLKRRKKFSKCHTCFDTGIAGGFYSPLESYCAKPPHREMTVLTPIFEMQPNDVVMWFNSRPRLKPRDIVADIDGRRWRIISIQRSEKSWALTRQTAQARLLSRDQIEYDVPIREADWGVDNLTVGALRQHIRATDIDSYNAAVKDLNLGEEKIFDEHSEIATNLEDSNAER